MPVIIRPARTEDIPAMAGLLGELFAIEADFEVDAARQVRGLTLLHQGGACLLVAEEDGEVAGMVSIQTLISTAQGGVVGLLEDLVVRTQSRGQGLGTRLLHAAQDWARTRGMTRVQLLADTANAPALRFYARHGWQGTQLVCLRLRDVV